MEKISVFINSNEEIASFSDGKYLNVFEKDNKWNLVKSIEVDSSKLQDMYNIRKYYWNLVKELGDCKILIVKKAVGIPYGIFYQEDFSIWELEGRPEIYFENILEKEKKYFQELEQQKKNEETLIRVLRNEYYVINLDEVQRKKPDLTSKMIIKPFLEKENFEILEIHCSHIPPWLELESLTGSIRIKSKKSGKENIVLYVSKN